MKSHAAACSFRHANSNWRVLAAIITLFFAARSEVRAGEARMFEGVDLSDLREVQQLRAMPELYELNPDTRRFQFLDGSFHIRLGEAWILYNPVREISYLNKVPGENPASYFGPVRGDIFEVFKLEERMIAGLRKDLEMDREYRLRLMLRSGNPKMRERALRIMAAALAPEVELKVRAFHAGSFRESISELKGDDVAPVLAAIEQTEKQIADAIPVIADDKYSPGNNALEKQGRLKDWMKVSVPVPDSAWGETVRGLRAAAVFSTNSLRVEEKISVWLLVENAGDHDIRFSVSDVIQTARAVIKRPDGTEVREASGWYTGLSPILRYKLQPGERITLAQRKIFFEKDPATDRLGFGEGRAAGGAGKYLVRYDSIQGTGTGKGEWAERLVTGETKLTVLP